MNNKQIWHGEGKTRPFEDRRIFANRTGRSEIIAAYYRDKVAEEKMRAPHLRDETLQERV